jgi:energy-converting hydrogenase Eha subunit F
MPERIVIIIAILMGAKVFIGLVTHLWLNRKLQSPELAPESQADLQQMMKRIRRGDAVSLGIIALCLSYLWSTIT